MANNEGGSTWQSSSSIPRKQVPSLNILSQLEVLRQVHKHASRLEYDYIHTWVDHELTKNNKDIEEKINIRLPGVDTEAVVMKYKSVEADATRRRRKDMEERREKMVLKSSAAATPSSSTSSAVVLRSKKKGKRPAPYKSKAAEISEERLLQSLMPRIVYGIPEGAVDKDYIEYRKCKYIEDIKHIRTFLCANLNSSVMNDLMSTLHNVAQYNNRGEHSLLTLQAVLMTPKTRDFRISSAKLCDNFVIRQGVDSGETEAQLANIESRIGTTILHYTLIDGRSLTHLQLEKCCCDSLLKVVADVSPNLRYLNISGSVVSDQGLFYLCGVEKSDGRARPRLSRQCKSKTEKEERLVCDDVPKWIKKPLSGCSKLVHFEGEHLQFLDWPYGGPGWTLYGTDYYKHPNVPMDAGFVAMLTFMPHLQTFITGVGGRTIQSWLKAQGKTKQPSRSFSPLPVLPNLEMVSETFVTPPMLEQVKNTCPNLTRLRIDWGEVSSSLHQAHAKEDWLEVVRGCKKLNELLVTGIDFKSPKFSQLVMPDIGANLTRLRLKELWRFKYSNFRAIKLHCHNLVVFSVSMTVKNIVTTINHINVDKDHNLQLSGDEKSSLANLREFHLSGPFGSELVRYMLRGAERLRVLTLGIEWPDPAFCDSQPQNRKDLIGPEYMTEILAVNKMKDLEEIHLMAQYRRGRGRLVKACADLILEKFEKIRHIGDFAHWNISTPDQQTIYAQVRSANRDILFEEDLRSPSNSEDRGSNFDFRYIERRHSFACNHIPSMNDTPYFLTELFANAMAAQPNMEDDDDISSDDDDDDDDDMSVELDAAETDDDDDFLDEIEDLEDDDDMFGADLEPACVIM